MKLTISKFVVVAAALMLLITGSPAAWADCSDASPNFATDFASGPNCLTLIGGSPAFVNTGANNTAPTVLRLTPNSGNQVAAVWFSTAQTVQNGFTTTFKFKFTNPSTPPADGIAFVIQNAGLSAIGSQPNGGALGYGDSDSNPDPSTGQGIQKSLAIEFDTFINGWDSNSANHVAIQTCGQGRNTSHHGQLCNGSTGQNSTVGFFPITSPIFSDGAQHSVTITYTPACSTCASGIGTLDVILDNTDITPGGVGVDLSTIGLTNGTAYVGFTAATGGDNENQDILSWTFTPTSTSTVVTTAAQAVFPATTTPSDDYTAQLTAGNPVTVQVTPIVISAQDCKALLLNSPFATAQCFLWKNTTPPNSAVMFEVTCPQSPGGTCGSSTNQTFFAELGNDFDFDPVANPGLKLNNPPTGVIAPPGNPLPGWLKGDGGILGHPCAQANPNAAIFQSNQIDSFFVDSDPAHLKGGSGGTGSCWLATYNTPGEDPSVSIATPANGGNYTLGQSVTADYSCSTANNPGGAIGPYITPSNCTGPVAPGGPVNTLTAGSHSFEVTVTDSVTDIASSTNVYNVTQGSTSTAITSNTPNPSLVGQSVIVGFTVTGVGVSSPVPTGNVTVTAGSGENCTGTVAAGSCSITFTTSGTRTLTANYGGDSNFSSSISPSVSQTVNPVIKATVSPSSIDFGTLYLGSLASKNVTVSNTGTAPLSISGPFLSIVKGGDSSEFVELNLCPKTLAVGKSCTITVVFVAGPFYTLQTTTLQVKDNAPDSPQLVTLQALVINPRATPSVNSLNFGNQQKTTTSAAKTVIIKNTGATLLTLGTVSTSANFALAAGTTCANGGTLAPSASCQIAVTFTPPTKANFSGTLTITDSAQNSPQKISLSGTGTN